MCTPLPAHLLAPLPPPPLAPPSPPPLRPPPPSSPPSLLPRVLPPLPRAAPGPRSRLYGFDACRAPRPAPRVADAYRLAPADAPLTEAAFQKLPLDFVGASALRWDGDVASQVSRHPTGSNSGLAGLRLMGCARIPARSRRSSPSTRWPRGGRRPQGRRPPARRGARTRSRRCSGSARAPRSSPFARRARPAGRPSWSSRAQARAADRGPAAHACGPVSRQPLRDGVWRSPRSVPLLGPLQRRPAPAQPRDRRPRAHPGGAAARPVRAAVAVVRVFDWHLPPPADVADAPPILPPPISPQGLRGVRSGLGELRRCGDHPRHRRWQCHGRVCERVNPGQVSSAASAPRFRKRVDVMNGDRPHIEP